MVINLHRLQFLWMYLRRPPWDSGITPPELYEYIASHPPGRAIDLGCGTGTNVITLAQKGWRVTGVDFIPKAIRAAKRKIENANIQADLRVGDVTNLSGIHGPFDLALDIGCFHGVDDKSAYLDELDRLLAPGGHWLMYGFFKPASPRAEPEPAEATLDLVHARGPSTLPSVAGQRFALLARTDGFDRRERPSAWFLFQKTSSNSEPRPERRATDTDH